MDHAQFHQENYGDSFFDFIAEHYGNKIDDHDNEHQEHQELPFKDCHNLCAHAVNSFMPSSTDFYIEPLEFYPIPFHFFYKESVSLFEKSSFFQPPRLA